MQDPHFIDFSPIAQYVLDEEHRIVRWNRACELLTGCPVSAMVGTTRQWEPFYAARRPTLADAVMTRDPVFILRVFGTGQAAKSLAVPNAWESNGFFPGLGGRDRHLHFIAAPILDEEGEVRGAVETLFDVTGQKKVEEALIKSGEGYRTLAENFSDGFVLVQDGRISLVNRSFALLLGYSNPEFFTGRRAEEFIAESHRDQFTANCEHVLNGRNHEPRPHWPHRARDGREVWLEGHPKRIEWNGRPAILSTLFDLTDSRRRETAMQSEAEKLREENLTLKSVMKERYKLGSIIGRSEAMQEVYELVIKAAASEASVIIYGESGTGKEIVARAIHDLSKRRDHRVVVVNCGAIPQELLESEFFGCRKGAFTGAFADRAGFLDMADKGTLFLDEVAELSLNMQAKLLRAVDNGSYTPLGSTEARRADARIVAASNRSLKEQVSAGRMREDFFFRLHVIPIRLPSLRERKGDIPLLVEHFVSLYRPDGPPFLPGGVMKAFFEYDWPGNVRELQNTIHRYLTIGTLDLIYEEEASREMQTRSPVGESGRLRTARDRFEEELVRKALEKTGGNRTRAAALLGLSRKSLYRKLSRCNPPDTAETKAPSH